MYGKLLQKHRHCNDGGMTRSFVTDRGAAQRATALPKKRPAAGRCTKCTYTSNSGTFVHLH